MNNSRLSAFDAEAIDVSAQDKSPTKITESSKVFGIYVGTAGDLEVVLEGGGDVTFKNLPVGFHPLEIATVKHTLTTASQLVILYARYVR